MIKKEIPSMLELTEVAKKLGIYFQELNREQLFLKLADYEDREEVPDAWFDDVFIYFRSVNKEEKDELLRKQYAVPESCIWPEKYKSQVLEIIGLMPNSFYGFNYFDSKLDKMNYVFTKNDKCFCESKLDFNRHFTVKTGAIEHKRTQPTDSTTCKKCGRRYKYFDMKNIEKELANPVFKDY